MTNTQHAPPSVQSSFVLPAKLASNTNQFNKGGMYFIRANITRRVNNALKLEPDNLIALYNKAKFYQEKKEWNLALES